MTAAKFRTVQRAQTAHKRISTEIKGGGGNPFAFLQNKGESRMQNGEREMRCSVRRAEQAEMQAVLAFAAQIFADEQQIPREMNVIPAEKSSRSGSAWSRTACSQERRQSTARAAGGIWPHYGRAVPARSAQGTFSDEKRADRGFCTGVWMKSFWRRATRPYISCAASVRRSPRSRSTFYRAASRPSC